MPCPSRDIRGPNRRNTNWNNWQRNAPIRVARYWEPISLPEFVNIVQRAEVEGGKLHVRAVGFL